MEPESTATEGARPTRGRPRDPLLAQRIVEAARAVYAAYGWAGFSFDAVAKTANVSRDAVYRRHRSREELLLAALSEASVPFLAAEPGVRDRLLDYSQAIYDHFTTGHGAANLRLHVDADQFPHLFDAYSLRVLEPALRAAETAIRAAMHRGELAATVNARALIAAILGGVLIQALLDGPHGSHRRPPGICPAVRSIVDQVLTGALPDPGNSHR
jgi:AcrR family transcriptional regulator